MMSVIIKAQYLTLHASECHSNIMSDTILTRDTTNSDAQTTSQYTCLQLDSQANFEGLLDFRLLMAGPSSMKPNNCED